MTRITSSRRARRAAAGLAGALALGFAAVPSANAAFTLAPCTGEGVFGRGASFQTIAINSAFIPALRLPANCGTNAPVVTYDPAGSGAGRRALGEFNATTNTNQDRDPSVRFAAADEPPTPTQRAQIEKGPIDANGADVTNADDGKLHVIPAAMGAVTIMVHMPAGCTDYGDASDPPGLGLFRDRPKISAAKVEQMLAGDAAADTWGEVLPGLTAGTDCAGHIVERVVRKDDSGTTFALKQWLAHVNPARGWADLQNTAWPNDAGATAVLRPAENGGGNVRNLLNDEAGDGGIGYADLGTSRGSDGAFLYQDGQAYDDHFYLPLEVKQIPGIYRDPQTSATGYKRIGTAAQASGGANCFNAEVKDEGATTLGDWSSTDSTYSPGTAGDGDYADCSLTYTLAFEDNSVVYCNSAAEERKARTVKDYLEKGVVSDDGQSRLRAADYSELPAEIVPKSRAGVAAIDWKKGTSGRPCSTLPGNGGGGGGGGGGTNTVFVPVGVTPPPPAISNAFTLSSVRFSRNRVQVTVQLPGAGTLTVSPTATGKKGRSIRLSRSTTTVSAAGTQRVSFALNAKAKTALKRFKRIKVRVAVAFTPNGGSAARKSRTLTIRAKRR